MKLTSYSLSIVLAACNAVNSNAFVASPWIITTFNRPTQLPIHTPTDLDVGDNDMDELCSMAELENTSWIKTFNLVDEDGSGFVDKDELKACLVSLCQPNSDKDIASLLHDTEGLALTDDSKLI